MENQGAHKILSMEALNFVSPEISIKILTLEEQLSYKHLCPDLDCICLDRFAIDGIDHPHTLFNPSIREQ